MFPAHTFPDITFPSQLCVFVSSEWCRSGLLWRYESTRCICECLPRAARCRATSVRAHSVALRKLPWPNTSCTAGGRQVSTCDSEAMAAAARFIVLIIINCWRPVQLLWASAISSSSRSWSGSVAGSVNPNCRWQVRVCCSVCCK